MVWFVMTDRFFPRAAWALSFLCLAAQAQESQDTLPELTVSAGALPPELATPSLILEGEALQRQRAATLGQTLAGEPGIHASPFGAGANHPVLRGMTGERTPVLSDGAPVQDAANVGPDHRITVEPLLASQIELLRGPAALLYGGNPAAGVLNVQDDKVPTALPAQGHEGRAELLWGSNAGEKTGAVALTGGEGALAWHVQALARDAGDYAVGAGWAAGRRLPGSWGRNDDASLGLSWLHAQGYLGLAYTRQTARYGLPGHDHAHEGCHAHGLQLHCDLAQGAPEAAAPPQVDMHSQRWDLRGEWRNPAPGWQALRLRAGHTDYQHDEAEAGQVVTTFRNRAQDLRLELQHAPLAGWQGLLGMTLLQRDFSAEGEEAYVPASRTQRLGLFALEEYRWQQWHWTAALRHERQRVSAPEKGLQGSHQATSLALQARWQWRPGYAVQANASYASRLPSAEELYAQGLHMATNSYELGDPGLRPETTAALELALRKTAGATTWSLSAYHHRVHDYIYGRTLDVQQGLQLLQYSQQDALFTGLEAQLRQRLNAHWGVTVLGDLVRARFAAGGDLPRIPAARAGLRLDARWQGWQGEAEWLQVARQSRVAALETPTPGYGMLNLGLSYRSGPWQLYAKGQNLTNRLAWAHTSFIKEAAPLAGRNLVLGMRVDF